MTGPHDDDPDSTAPDPSTGDEDLPVAEPLSDLPDFPRLGDVSGIDPDDLPTIAEMGSDSMLFSTDGRRRPGPKRPPISPKPNVVSPYVPRAESPREGSSVWPVTPGADDGGAQKYGQGEEIGRGGMGAIYRVRDRNLNRELAMKVLLHQKATDAPRRASSSGEPDLLQRFLEEAQVTAQLDHPGVVPVHELGVDAEGHAFFTMSLVRGETLSSVFHKVQTGRDGWTQTKALQALHRACETMAFAHSKHVIHRDLKPANVMVGKFGEVYVMDWGLAKVRGGAAAADDGSAVPTNDVQTIRSHEGGPDHALETLAGRVVGTPAYMPPEQAHGRLHEVDAQSDVYSLGAMLYQLLSGQPPYMPPGKEVSAAQLLLAVMKDAPTPLAEVAPTAPPELVSICEKAMSRDRPTRYADAADLGDDLNRFLTGHVVRAYKTGALVELRKWIQRNRAVSATAAVAALVLVAVTVAFLISLQSERDEAQSQRDEAGRQRDEAGRQRDETARQRDEAGRQRDRAQTAEKTATQRAEEAEQERAAKSKVLDDLFRLADSKRLADLSAAAETLWPIHPKSAPQMLAWVDRARVLLANLPEHRATLLALEERAEPYTEAQRTRDFAVELVEQTRLQQLLEATENDTERAPLQTQLEQLQSLLTTRRTWSFPSEQLAWQHAILGELVAGIEALGATPTGLLGGVTRRLQQSADLRVRTLGDPADAWEEAIGQIADKRVHPQYSGLIITPQLGLLPLGADPQSGLFEFAHVNSGKLPTRDPETGRLVLEEKSCIVLVLVPGSTFWMGAQSGAEGGSNYDPEARADEGPVHEVTLSPYFLSKYECTQAQWWNLTGGAVPSTYRAGARVAGQSIGWRNPVELVTWDECDLWLRRYNLTLPTEAQWERACRADSQSRWSGVDAPVDLRANVADEFLRENGGPPEWPYTVEINDGHGVHAPVGSYPANGFGFHDLHGNVSEWCRDRFSLYGELPQIDPIGSPDAVDRVKRGGAWDSTAFVARSAFREHLKSNIRAPAVGLRAARALDVE